MTPNDWTWLGKAKRFYVYILIAILAGVLLRHLEQMQERAEPVFVESMLISLNGLAMAKFASAYAADRRADLEQLVGANPMLWAQSLPPTYGGEIELNKTDWKKLPAARWYFDRSGGALVYKVASPEQLENAAIPSDQLKFRVQLLRASEGSSNITGMRIEPVYPYRWRRDVELPVSVK